MTRHHMTPQGLVQFTAAEEVARDAEEQEWADGADDRAAAANRDTRNQLLSDSDWTQFNDSPLTGEVKTSWATYRQTLRDITSTDDWPNVSFPATP
jgi:hypothetical protein